LQATSLESSYQCVVENKYGEISSSLALDQQSATLDQPVVKKSEKKNSIVLEAAVAVADEQLKQVTWTKDGKTVVTNETMSQSKYSVKRKTSTISSSETIVQLEIEDAKPEDVGSYEVMAQNISGEIKTQKIHIDKKQIESVSVESSAAHVQEVHVSSVQESSKPDAQETLLEADKTQTVPDEELSTPSQQDQEPSVPSHPEAQSVSQEDQEPSVPEEPTADETAAAEALVVSGVTEVKKKKKSGKKGGKKKKKVEEEPLPKPEIVTYLKNLVRRIQYVLCVNHYYFK
jgi:hypothetical protein